MRRLLSELNGIAAQFSGFVDFLFVYILEAHAADEWQIKELPVEIPQHRNVDDRIKAASSFFAQYALHENFTLTVDNPENDFVDLYCSWPFRYWVIDNGIIQAKCMPKREAVSLDALRSWLRDYAAVPDGM